MNLSVEKNKIDLMIKNARVALGEYMKMDQQSIDKIVEKVASVASENSKKLAEMAFLETKKGVLKDKIEKNLFASRCVFDSIKNKKTVGIIKEDLQGGFLEIADPLGVIACITPVTNPTSTTIFKAIICIKTRNPVIFAFHPGARNSCIETAKVLKEAAISAGAPENAISWLETSSIQLTSMLINHEGVDVILATGGTEMVKAAYSVGKPALGVGPGNVPCYIEKTADLKRTCRDIILSKTFDNGMICASEQAVIVDEEVSKKFEMVMKGLGCYFLEEKQIEKLSNLIFDKKKDKINPEIVGKSAFEIAKMIDLEVPIDTKILICKLEKVGPEVPLSAEKLSPILAYYVCKDCEHAFKICADVLEFGGKGHTAAIHTEDENMVRKFGLKMMVGRVIVNSPSTQGAIGGIYNSNVPSLTLGCGSYGGNSISSNVSVENLLNLKRIFRRNDNVKSPCF